MKEKIKEIIIKHNNSITLNSIKSKIDIEDKKLEKILNELKLEGIILQQNNKYSIFPENMYIGKISITKNCNKVIFHNGRIYHIPHNYINSLFINDTVSFTINENDQAEITSIIDRSINEVTCIVKEHGKKKKLECFHPGIEILLDDEELNKLKSGDIVVVSIGKNKLDDNFYYTKIKEIIGNESDPNIDELTIARNYGFDNYYSEEYLEELSKIPTSVKPEDIENRHDLRHLPIITIDGIDAKDMDDAVYAEKTENGYKVYVNISDVSHYVKYGTEIFKRAFEKGTSYYSNNTVLHMLHSLLANGICSLNPNTDRLTKTVIIDIDNKGNIISYDIFKSVINSKKKMNYDDVDKLLNNEEYPESYKPFQETIKTLHELATKLENKALHINGKLDFPSDELIKTFDEEGNITSSKTYESTPATKIIEYLMISANECVAQYIYWCGLPSIYRIHDIPDIDKVNKTIKNINETDIEVKFKTIKSVNNPKVIQSILNELSNIEEYPIIAGLLLQDMQRAEYNTENIGHYALGLAHYTHFTSPIRRLCDLIIHILLDILLEDNNYINKIDFKKLESFLQEASRQASKMERQADAGEYEANRLAIIKSLEPYIGEEFEAIITEVSDNIKIKMNGIDTYVKYKYLSDNFAYDPSKGKFYDKYNNEYLKLGTKIIVQLSKVNLNTRNFYVDILGIVDSKKLTKKK